VIQWDHRCLNPTYAARFQSPLVEPDVTISIIRLSDEFHTEAFAKPSLGNTRIDNTPSSALTASFG